jgi:hypothetical protein
MISGSHHNVDENCALLGYYTMSSGNSLQMFYYRYSLLNNPEEHRSVHHVYLG